MCIEYPESAKTLGHFRSHSFLTPIEWIRHFLCVFVVNWCKKEKPNKNCAIYAWSEKTTTTTTAASFIYYECVVIFEIDEKRSECKEMPENWMETSTRVYGVCVCAWFRSIEYMYRNSSKTEICNWVVSIGMRVCNVFMCMYGNLATEHIIYDVTYTHYSLVKASSFQCLYNELGWWWRRWRRRRRRWRYDIFIITPKMR